MPFLCVSSEYRRAVPGSRVYTAGAAAEVLLLFFFFSALLVESKNVARLRPVRAFQLPLADRPGDEAGSGRCAQPSPPPY